jgi:DNA-binding MarR family transcriptional regulator
MAGKTFEASVVDLSHSFGMLMRRARVAATGEELSWSETAVLKRLFVGGPATTAELARVQGMKPQSMRMIVASLEELGMVERKAHETDGRQVNLVLTESGAAEQKRAGDAKRMWLAQAIAQLDERDQETLFEAGTIMRRLVEAEKV